MGSTSSAWPPEPSSMLGLLLFFFWTGPTLGGHTAPGSSGPLKAELFSQRSAACTAVAVCYQAGLDGGSSSSHHGWYFETD